MTRRCARNDGYDWMILREEDEDGSIDDTEPGAPTGG